MSLRIDDIDPGDILTPADHHVAHDYPPAKLRAREIVREKENPWSDRMVRKVVLDELDPDTDEVIPDDGRVDDGRRGSYTGQRWAARSLKAYAPVHEAWQADVARHKAVTDTTRALGTQLRRLGIRVSFSTSRRHALTMRFDDLTAADALAALLAQMGAHAVNVHMPEGVQLGDGNTQVNRFLQ